MVITKVIHLTEDELEVLVSAGKLIKSVKLAQEAAQAEKVEATLDENTQSMFVALAKVLDTSLNLNGTDKVSEE